MKRILFLFLLLISPLEATRNTLTDNWWGWGDQLHCLGVDLTASYFIEIAANPIGGKSRGWTHTDNLGLNAKFDLDTLAGWTNWSLFNSWVFRSGSSLSSEYIGNAFPVQQLYGGQNLRLNELYLENSIPCSHFHFKVGRLDEGNNFLTSPLYCYFNNNAFCGNPISIFKNGPFSSYPNATWGAYLRFMPIHRISAKFGIYNANGHISANRYHGMNFAFHNTNGVQIITEWAYLNHHEEDDCGLIGSYKVGAFYYTGKFPRFTGGNPKGNYCYYFLFDQMFWKDGDNCNRHLTGFITALFAPDSKNQFPYFGSAALLFQGLFPQRPFDVTALGAVYGAFSHSLRTTQRQAGLPPQTYESVLELTHTIRVNNWLTITPDLQYVFNPNGTNNIPNAFVVELQIGVTI